MISHINNLRENFRLLTLGMTQQEIYESFGLAYGVQAKIIKSDIVNCYITSLEKFANNLELSISELFLEPHSGDKYSEWYIDAGTKYFASNLTQAIDQENNAVKKIKEAGIKQGQLRQYCLALVLPRLGKVQSIADALEIEVADLFLPPS